MQPTFILIDGKTMLPFVFAVPPEDLEIQAEQQIRSVNLIQFGEYLKAGERNCDVITFSSFFPDVKSTFYKPLLNPMLPLMCVKTIVNAKDNGRVFKFVVPEFFISKDVVIESFKHIYNERTGDINFEITLREIRKKGKINKWLGLIER